MIRPIYSTRRFDLVVRLQLAVGLTLGRDYVELHVGPFTLTYWSPL